jgi:transposase-like protein
MNVNKTNKRKKRTQRDYTLAFKLQVIAEVEQGELTYKQVQKKYGIQGKSTVLVWLRKYGTLDWKIPIQMETPDKRIKKLEAQLFKLESELKEEKLKRKFLDVMIDVAEDQFGYQIRKKSSPKQSKTSPNKRK